MDLKEDFDYIDKHFENIDKEDLLKNLIDCGLEVNMKEINLKLKALDSSDFKEAKKLIGEEVYFISDIKNPSLDECDVLDSIRFTQWTTNIFFNTNDEAYPYIIKKD